MSFTPLGDVLQHKLAAETPLKKQIDAAQIVEYTEETLKELFGEDLSLHARPLFLKNRTLTISCSSSVIVQEIRLNQTMIVEKINEKIGKPEVDRIRYLV